MRCKWSSRAWLERHVDRLPPPSNIVALCFSLCSELRSGSECAVLHADRVRFGAWRAEMANRVSRTMHGNADFSGRGALAKLIVAVFYLHRFARCLGNDFERSLTTASR